MAGQTITVYGADWCGDCRRTKQFLLELNMPFTWVDTDADPEAETLVKRKNNGKRIIPTVVFEDGSFLSEPSNEELAEKLGINIRA